VRWSLFPRMPLAQRTGAFDCTAKTGQVALMRTATMEHSEYGIRVNGIAPGGFASRRSIAAMHAAKEHSR
jgi:NAD(P)-dependent dehydrogenase (short-subunit alcohol dehydrogenase family)